MKAFLTKCKSYFIVAGIFSLFINVLMLAMPIYMMQVFDRVITSRSMETLTMLTIAVLGAYVLHLFLELFRGRVLLGAGIALDGMAGPPVLNNALSAFVRPGSGPQAAGLRDVATLRGFLTGHGIFALFDLPWMPIFIFVIFLFHPVMGMTAVLGAIALFTLAWINERVTRAPLAEMSQHTRRASRYIDASMRNIEVASALGMIDPLIRRWRRMNADVIDAQVIAGRRAAVLSGLTRFTRLSLQIVMLGIGAYLVIQQHVSPGVMMAGTLILARALAPIESAIHTWKGFVEAREAYGKLADLLGDGPADGQRTQLPAPQGRLLVERVTFGIPGQDRLIIKGVGFALDPGESLGLIGPSAAGKSTLARLLTGIWRPASGTVRLDGADISTLPREHIGPHLGYVPQDVELFSGTVGENIARLQETFEAADVVEAAQRAFAHDMIVQLPKAYDTEIGESGAQISAGQRQRIALARALFGKPRLVVLDEPNANLDAEGEEALVQTLRGLKRDGATVITISHRPSLLAHVDKLLVLRDGQVELFGPRAEVVARLKSRGAMPESAPAAPVPITGRQHSGT